MLISFAWDYSTCEKRKPRIKKMKNSCPLLDSNGGLYAYEAKDALLDEISIEHLNGDCF